MTSAFAAQLRTIAANSTNELDLRARRDAHAKSLIFDRNVAVKQDWDTLYQICLEGFQELCLLDSRLREFEQNLYSPQAKDQDREQLSKTQNEALNVVLEQSLTLLGSKVLLRPGIKAVEWLVRRFQVHIYNSGALLATFLPYHETTIFRNVLQIIPANKVIGEWKFLGPYYKDAVNTPRHAIVHNATHNDAFFSYLNNYTLRACQDGANHSQLLRFWSSVIVEAITGRLSQVRSGRREVQRQRNEDALLKILPLLEEGFEVEGCPEMTYACFTISLVLAGNLDLDDHVINALMKSISPFMINGEADARSALVSIAILVKKKEDKRLPKAVLDLFMRAIDQSTDFTELDRQVPLASLCEALASSALSGLKQKNLESRIRFVERIIRVAKGLSATTTRSHLLAVVLQKLQPKDEAKPAEPVLRGRLVQMLQTLNESSDFAPYFANAASLASLSQSEVEAILGGTIQSPPGSGALEATAMDLDTVEDNSTSQSDAAKLMLASLTPQAYELSFLTQSRSSLFDQLVQAFSLCNRNEELLAEFEDLSLWRQKTENPTDLHTGFLLRLALGPAPATDRYAAVQLLAKSLEKSSRKHTQLLIPYITVLLSDSAQSVRRAAVTCMIAVHKCVSKKEAEAHPHSAETIYDALCLTNVKCVPPTQVLKLLNQVFLPHMEECVLDSSQIHQVLDAALNGPSRTSLPTESELSKTLKHTLFDLLTGCALRCPLLKVRTGIIELLMNVSKVGTSSTSKILSPILEEWSSRSDAEAEAAILSEGLSKAHVDSVMVQLVKVQEKGMIEHIFAMLADGAMQPRAALIVAFYDRIASTWKDVPQSSQVSAAVRLFDMCFSNAPANATGSRGVLHGTSLSTEVLAAVLEHSLSGLAQMQSEAPSKKRRRTSQGRESLPKDMATGLEVNGARLTFALELAENSKPESHPRLLGELFEVLISLRRWKDKTTSESPYLLNLCLSSILAIIDKARQSKKPNLDLSSIRTDLVTDCVRSSENPQVQSIALLLSAALASISPDRVLHTIMPIFTFTGSSILSKDDERSIYVTNRAIDEIIPPLVASLKKQNAKNLIQSTSSLLSSFVTAYDHVPQHRRVAFYQRLISRLGADDFAFAIIALFASRRPKETMSIFFTNLVGDFPASTQLQTVRKLLDLIVDLYSEHPHNAEPLLEITSTTPTERREQEALVILEVAAKLIKPKSLKARVEKLDKSTEAERDSFWAEFKTCTTRLLGLIKSQKTQPGSSIIFATRGCLSAVLELPPLSDLLAIMPDLINELDQVEDTKDLQPFALRVLATQLRHNTLTAKDSATQTEAVAFLPTLNGIIRTSPNESLRQAAIQCLDRIVETYGRKNPDAVIAASACLLEDGNQGLQSLDERTQIMSLLCLATSMEVLKEGGVPIVLGAMSSILHILHSSLSATKRPEVHNACYTLLAAFITHVPFMVSDENLTEIFKLSYSSCQALREDVSCKEARLETLRLIGWNIGLDSVTSTLSQVFKLSKANKLDTQAVLELMDVLCQAVEQSSKATVVKSADLISNLIVQTLSLRQSLVGGDTSAIPEDEYDPVQNKLNALGIIFIYKLNDTAFRPMFESWVDWAVKGRSEGIDVDSNDSTATMYRMTSFFSFANHFFDTLKSIVTSYASYILPVTNEVLQSVLNGIPTTDDDMKDTKSSFENRLDLSDPHNLSLYKATLTLLTTLASHDADSFFTSPSHFQPLASLLVEQYTLLGASPFLSTKKSRPMRESLTSQLTTTLIALATAVQDVPAHHHTMNHLLCQLRHSSHPSARLASISTHIAITESEVGEEWLQNAVLGQASTTEEGGVTAVNVGGSGETMVYVNEMLEDDEEDVEMAVRRWVRMVRERVGEDVFEV